MSDPSSQGGEDRDLCIPATLGGGVMKPLDLTPWVDAGLIDPDDGGPGRWVRNALCGQTDPEAFFPEERESSRSAKRICGLCDVKTECLTYALVTREPHGIWGGVSPRVRQRMPVPKPPLAGKAPQRAAPAPAASFYHVQAGRHARAIRMMAAGVPSDVVAEQTHMVPDTVRRLWREHQAAAEAAVTDGPRQLAA